MGSKAGAAALRIDRGCDVFTTCNLAVGQQDGRPFRRQPPRRFRAKSRGRPGYQRHLAR
jgi:hypothetical protein